LSGFEWDRAELRPEHLHWARSAAQEIAQRGGIVAVLGATDRSRAPGARGALRNEQLALERANAVIERLRHELGTDASVNFYATGLSDRYASAPVGHDRAETDRYVIVAQIVVSQTAVPAPIPDWLQCLTLPCPSTNFYIRSFGVLNLGVSGGAGVASGGLGGVLWRMIISDGLWGQLYSFEGASATGGLVASPRGIPNILPALSVGDGGPWHRFRTRVPTTVAAFSPSQISFRSAAGGISTSRGGTRLEVRFHSEHGNKVWHDFQLGDQIGIDTFLNLISGGVEATFGSLQGRTDGRPSTRPGFYPTNRCVRRFNTGSQVCAD
jgi:hypothetical protein